MNEVTCLFLSVTESDPPHSWRSGMGKVVYLGFFLDSPDATGNMAQDRSAGSQQKCAVRKGVTGKTRRIVYPRKRAGVNAMRHFL
ncbi:hypothetical protein ACQJ0O_22660 [Pseudomonas shirazensis]|uniref:hypothetical protein n=1 Tax=Pseudomonas TaxID=286 RepID=UPI0015E18E73|nr:hypothetical protein [Pseudomonas putida]